MIRNLLLTLLGVEGILIAALLAIVGCDAKEAVSSETEPVVTMEKTECFGTCPVYSIRIYADGKAEFQGEKHVNNIGHFQRQLPLETVTALVRNFQEANFFAFQDEYVAEVTDLPVTYLSFRHEDRYKKIKNLIDAPLQLKNLEQQVADIAGSGGWQAVAE